LKFPENHVVLSRQVRPQRDASRPLSKPPSSCLGPFDRELRGFDARIALAKEKKELLEHRAGEIDRAKISPGEKEKLEESIRVLEHANEVFEGLCDGPKTPFTRMRLLQ